MEDEAPRMTPAAIAALLQGEFENAAAAMTPGGIRQQEAEGQRELVNSRKLPIKCGSAPGLESCPHPTCKDGDEVWVGDEVVDEYLHQLEGERAEEAEERPCRVCGGTKLHPDALERLRDDVGIVYVERVDDLFAKVDMPKGWGKEATDHNMHNDLFDAEGNKRASIFYKAAFYDRRADIKWKARYGVTPEYKQAPGGDPTERPEDPDALEIQRPVALDRATGEILNRPVRWFHRMDEYDEYGDARDTMKDWLDENVEDWDHCIDSW